MGIDAGNEVREGLEKLSTAQPEIWCSRFSILEALWIAARFAADGKLDPELFGFGLNSILKGGSYMMVEEEPEVYQHALQMYSAGHRDMIDNLLYASSTRLGLRLLTVDSKLRAFIRSKNLEDTLLTPSEL